LLLSVPDSSWVLNTWISVSSTPPARAPLRSPDHGSGTPDRSRSSNATVKVLSSSWATMPMSVNSQP
jgi:hypothetical protein